MGKLLGILSMNVLFLDPLGGDMNFLMIIHYFVLLYLFYFTIFKDF